MKKGVGRHENMAGGSENNGVAGSAPGGDGATLRWRYRRRAGIQYEQNGAEC